MKLRAKLDDVAAFFYWLQVVAQWDKSYAHDRRLLDYYRQAVAAENDPALNTVREILLRQTSPYGLLAQLYSGDVRE